MVNQSGQWQFSYEINVFKKGEKKKTPKKTNTPNQESLKGAREKAVCSYKNELRVKRAEGR